MPTVYLQNGPCDGQTKRLTQRQYASEKTTCKGAEYVHNPDAVVKGHPIVFVYLQPETGTGGGGGGGGGQYAPNVYKGWHPVQTSVNQTMPTALHRIGVSQRRLLQTLAHRRRRR